MHLTMWIPIVGLLLMLVVEMQSAIAPPRPSGLCECWGEPHCFSFDGKFFHHMGLCEYVMARDKCYNSTETPTFVVTATMRATGNVMVSAVDGVKIEVGSLTISMGTFWSGGPPIAIIGGGVVYNIQFIGLFVVVFFPTINLRVEWNFKEHVIIKVGPGYFDDTCGLCGIYNDDPSDDFTMGPACTATVPPPPPLLNGLTSDVSDFGNSWWIENTIKPPHRCCMPRVIPPHHNQTIVDICDDIIAIFGHCFNGKPRLLAIKRQSCIMDLFFFGWNFLCSIVRDFNKFCCDCGIVVDNWGAFTYCKPNCGPNGHFEVCAPPEADTCDRLIAGGPPPPQNPKVPGCHCNPNFYLRLDQCVPPEDCGCLHKNIFYMEGQILLDKPCISYLVCRKNQMVRKWLNCDQDPKATCPIIGGRIVCICPPFTFDLHGDGSECVYCDFFGPKWTALNLAVTPNCYYFSKREMNHFDAEDHCEKLDPASMLVVIDDAAENNEIWKRIKPRKGNPWIGMRIDRDVSPRLEYWLRYPGLQAAYTNFMDGEPNRHQPNESCVQIRRKTGKWNDMRCEKGLKYICEIIMRPLIWIWFGFPPIIWF